MVYAVSIAVLVVAFALATVRPINLGLLAFAGAFAIGSGLSGISLEEIQGFFPGDMFLTVLGITLLFGVARANGTVDLLLERSLRLVGGRPWAVAWMMFLLAAALMSLGAVLAIGMLAPIAMPLAKRFGIKPLLMSAMLGHGAFGAAFSPVTVYSVSIQQLLDEQGYSISALTLFIVPFGLNLLLAVTAFVTMGRHLLRRQPTRTAAQTVAEAKARTPATVGAAARTASSGGADSAPETGPDPATGPSRVTAGQWTTLAAIGSLLGAALLGVDVGVAATFLSVALLLAFPALTRESVGAIGWPAILMVCGVMTYMEVMTANGTIEYLGEKALDLPSMLLTALVLLLAVGMISAVGSSFGIILISLQLAAPLMASGELPVTALVLALCFCATTVDVSPFSSNGVLVLGSAIVPDRQRFQRRMLAYTGYVVAAAALLSWGLLVLPSAA
ncbi:SLC13 family permease [Streptomyces sp. DH41]|uniref:SLC13 family permease n=1 Tax=Streptomyces sp. DH41 TaxID=3040125 RepID=UPI002441390C|nr:SLC13 family permease [Streptomyces sp. DH41]MDG9722871.1 hypothetical protein [Streptomyces sp. DH41]